MIEKFGDDLYLLEKIAAGGMAEVYRAKQMGYGGFEKTVALKRILPNFAQNDEFKQMFRQEANLSGSLQHQNIAQVFGNGEHLGYLYLIMEFVDGKNVRQILARADKRKIKIPIELSLFIVAEAARGLQYAHDHIDEKTGQHLEIVHRDMSPQNIMLGYDSSVKVVDFGIAKAAARSGQTRAGVLKGKFGYMSPEQAQGQHIDKRTDVFALGIILFELLTQRRLFTAEDDLKTLQLVRDCKVPRASKYNPDVKDTLDMIVLKALAKDRNDRYETAGEFYAEVTRFLVHNYPKHLPTDLGKFIRTIFADDIKEEKRRRDKINAELPARPAEPIKKSAPVVSSEAFGEIELSNDPTQEATEPADHTKTQKTSDITATQKTDDAQPDTTPDLPLQDLPPRPTRRPPPPSVRGGSRELTLMSFDKEDSSARLSTNSEVISSTGSRPSVHHSGISSIRLEKALNPQAVKARKFTRLVSVGLSVVALWFVATEMLSTPQVEQLVLHVKNQILSGQQILRTEVSRIPASQEPSANNIQADVSIQVPIKENTQTTNPKRQESIPQTQAPVPLPQDSTPESPPIPTTQGSVVSTLKPSELPLKIVGYLTLVSTPEANQILLNDQLLVDENDKPLRTPLKDFPLPPGKYKLEMKSTFFEVTHKGTFTIEKNKINTVEVFLKK